MSISDPTTIVTDPFLLSVLQTTASTRAATLSLLDQTSQEPTQTRSPPSSPPQYYDHASISTSQKSLNSSLSALRALNRRLAHAARATKAQTSASRTEIDRLHLQLQNLYYESRHLQGEIDACEHFRHSYEELPLMEEGEFMLRWPRGYPPPGTKAKEGNADEGRDVQEGGEEVSAADEMQTEVQDDTVEDQVRQRHDEGSMDTDGPGEEDVGDDYDEPYWLGQTPDALMRARIEAEYDDRVALEERRKELVTRKMALVRENAKRKEELGKLDAELESFIDAAKPIQKILEKEWGQEGVAKT